MAVTAADQDDLFRGHGTGLGGDDVLRLGALDHEALTGDRVAHGLESLCDPVRRQEMLGAVGVADVERHGVAAHRRRLIPAQLPHESGEVGLVDSTDQRVLDLRIDRLGAP